MNVLFDRKLIFLLLLTIIMSIVINFRHESFKHELIKSDGRGYYAYLPALLLFNDPDYEKVLEVEKYVFEGRTKQAYLFSQPDGHKYNKYFPGVSVMQAPFFICATVGAKILGTDVNGYSTLYLYMLYLGSLFYTLAGIVFLYKVALNFCRNSLHAFWGVFFLYFGTQLFYNTLSEPSFSHNYSFFLFSALFFAFQKYADKPNIKRSLIIGVIFGLIFLVRPTNILIALFLPFLLINKDSIIEFFKRFFTLKNKLLISVLSAFLLIASILPILWKWQTGQWLVWSYNGEGFNFLSPYFFETLFSYRAGIFVNTPLLFISLIGLWFLFKKDQFSSWIWVGYLLVLIYVTSSWWCWDYESSFGHRALSEHSIIFLFPLIHLFRHKKLKSFTYIVCSLCFLYTGMRYYQKHTGVFEFQKFTALTYWKSMGDFSLNEKNKYTSLKHCQPLGDIIEKSHLSYKDDEIQFNKGNEFTDALVYQFPIERYQNRFMFEAQFEKKLIEPDSDWREIFLVFDATNEQTGERIYYASPIYEYYKEGKDGWHSTVVQNEVPVTFQPMESVAVYLWNPQHKKVNIRDFKVEVREIGI